MQKLIKCKNSAVSDVSNDLDLVIKRILVVVTCILNGNSIFN